MKRIKGERRRRHLYIRAASIEKFVAEIKYRFESKQRMDEVVEICFTKVSTRMIIYKAMETKKIFIFKDLTAFEAVFIGNSCPPALTYLCLGNLLFSPSISALLENNKTFKSIAIDAMKSWEQNFDILKNFVEIYCSNALFKTNVALKSVKSYKFLKLARLSFFGVKFSSKAVEFRLFKSFKYLKNIKSLSLTSTYSAQRKEITFQASLISKYDKERIQNEKTNLLTIFGFDLCTQSTVDISYSTHIENFREVVYWLNETKKNNCFEYFGNLQVYRSKPSTHFFKLDEFYSINHVQVKAIKQNFRSNILSLLNKN